MEILLDISRNLQYIWNQIFSLFIYSIKYYKCSNIINFIWPVQCTVYRLYTRFGYPSNTMLKYKHNVYYTHISFIIKILIKARSLCPPPFVFIYALIIKCSFRCVPIGTSNTWSIFFLLLNNKKIICKYILWIKLKF